MTIEINRALRDECSAETRKWVRDMLGDFRNELTKYKKS
jgi:hypothetical protein